MGLLMLLSGQVSAYVCTGAGSAFVDPVCDADEISAAIGTTFDDTLLAKDDEPFSSGSGSGGSTEFGVLEITQPAGGPVTEVRFTYTGTTPQIIVEKAGTWYSVYDWQTQISDGDGYYYFIRDFGDFDCAAQGVNCIADTSYVAAYGVVPVPAALWLFTSGLLGLMGIARRRRAA